MSVIEKSNINLKKFSKQFKWLNFDSFPDSDGYGFQLYFPGEKKVTNADLILAFYALFKPFLKKIEISLLEPNVGGGGWGDFCIDTWDIRNDTYDYSPQGKSKETARYLEMLQENGMEPKFNGLCRCHDWDQFLPVILDCIMTCRAPYSLYFYHPPQEFFFYFHHTRSFGIYYKCFNEAIMHILTQAKAANLELWNWNDEKSLAALRG